MAYIQSIVCNKETFFFSEISRIRLISEDILEEDNVAMLELAEDFDFTDRSDWESFPFVIQPNL